MDTYEPLPAGRRVRMMLPGALATLALAAVCLVLGVRLDSGVSSPAAVCALFAIQGPLWICLGLAWRAERRRSRLRSAPCPRCGHPLTGGTSGNATGVCPECGIPMDVRAGR